MVSCSDVCNIIGSGTVSLGWAYFLGSIMETLGSTLLSGNVIKKLVAGIINITAYQSNQTEEMIKFEKGEPYLINENMLLLGEYIGATQHVHKLMHFNQGWDSLIGFSSYSLVFCERKSDWLVKRANRSSRSFVMSDGSGSLTVCSFVMSSLSK